VAAPGLNTGTTAALAAGALESAAIAAASEAASAVADARLIVIRNSLSPVSKAGAEDGTGAGSIPALR
jgi:hypothetical protein